MAMWHTPALLALLLCVATGSECLANDGAPAADDECSLAALRLDTVRSHRKKASIEQEQDLVKEEEKSAAASSEPKTILDKQEKPKLIDASALAQMEHKDIQLPASTGACATCYPWACKINRSGRPSVSKLCSAQAPYYDAVNDVCMSACGATPPVPAPTCSVCFPQPCRVSSTTSKLCSQAAPYYDPKLDACLNVCSAATTAAPVPSCFQSSACPLAAPYYDTNLKACVQRCGAGEPTQSSCFLSQTCPASAPYYHAILRACTQNCDVFFPPAPTPAPVPTPAPSCFLSQSCPAAAPYYDANLRSCVRLCGGVIQDQTGCTQSQSCPPTAPYYNALLRSCVKQCGSAPTSPSPPYDPFTTPSPVQCKAESSASCNLMQCGTSYGATSCLDGTCVCDQGYCADRTGVCKRNLNVPLPPAWCTIKTSGTCSFFSCSQKHTMCKEGTCVCENGYCFKAGHCIKSY